MPRTSGRADVVVIGGGPSGLRTAGRLAGSGLDVRLFEKKPAVGRDVICTGIVGKEVFEDFGLPSGSVIRDIRTVRLVSPFATEVTYEHPGPFAHVVDREAFDGHVAAWAREAGASVETGCRAEDISVGPDGVAVTVISENGGRFVQKAGMAVIATGIDCVLQKKAGLGVPADFLKGAQADVAVPESDVTSIFVGRNVAPGGFAWCVPSSEGRARVGLLTKADARGRLEGLLAERFPDAGTAPGGARIRTKPIAQGLLAPTAAERVLSVGEAAGQVKTTTGGGVSYGLLCADLAAEAILRCFDKSEFGAEALAGYERGWRKAIQKEIVVGAYTRAMCSRLSDRRIEGLFHLAQTDGIIPIIRDKADFDWHSGLIMALLQRLSFMRFFRTMKERLGTGSLS
jgi:digeranylgeranylglycerophospholipid reductase